MGSALIGRHSLTLVGTFSNSHQINILGGSGDGTLGGGRGYSPQQETVAPLSRRRHFFFRLPNLGQGNYYHFMWEGHFILLSPTWPPGTVRVSPTHTKWPLKQRVCTSFFNFVSFSFWSKFFFQSRIRQSVSQICITFVILCPITI